MFSLMRSFEFDKNFDNLFNDYLGLAYSNGIVNEDGSYSLEVDLPGVDPNSVELSVNGTCLTITGKRGNRSGTRYISVNKLYNLNKAEASLQNGVLTVKIPLKDEAKPSKIKVKVL